MKEITLNVKGMSCGHCKASVEDSLNALDGVSNVKVDLDSGKVNVTYDEAKVKQVKLQEAIEDQGYDVVA
ncbi:MAG TPA: copper chaperone CopZ [Candidatus Avamphibacillus intestinigallinarum]|nr:copper chaperone CopZ [Candidatus Avamphibacillus intestinigallinarum]